MEETRETTVKKPIKSEKLVKQEKVRKPQKDKKKICSIVVFAIGLFALVAGLVFLILSFLKGPELQDGEYLISVDYWKLEDGSNCLKESEEADMNCDASQVFWKFTEIGKGTLTTNGHENDYDFIWAIEDNKLRIETEWLYNLENEYEYSLNQSEGTLTLKEDGKEVKFLAKSDD